MVKEAQTIKLFVQDSISIFDTFDSTSSSFFMVEGISFGYRYSIVNEPENEDLLERAFDVLFEETLRRFRLNKGKF